MKKQPQYPTPFELLKFDFDYFMEHVKDDSKDLEHRKAALILAERTLSKIEILSQPVNFN